MLINNEKSVVPQVLPDYMITTEAQLKEYISELNCRNVSRVSLDMEGDQGSIRYKYSISIFQIFDGQKSAVLDVLKMGPNQTLKNFLTSSRFEKVMFSCNNDVYMAQNVLGCTIAPIRDIAIGQKLLGLPVNLAEYLNIEKQKKDSFQRANWLTRPIKADLLEYAVNDVLKLLMIEQEIAQKLKETKQIEEYLNAADSISKRNFKVHQHQQFLAKFPGYSRLNSEKKRLAASIWIFRELLGEKLNCPVGYLLSKKSMTQILHSEADLHHALECELNRGRRDSRKIRQETIRILMAQAASSPFLPKIVSRRPKRTITPSDPALVK